MPMRHLRRAVLALLAATALAAAAPAADFTPVLHSVSYAGVWRGQARLEVDEPNVRAAFDAWSPALGGMNGEELAAAARKLAPYMVYTTVADYVKHPRLRYDATVTNYVRGDDLVRAVPFGKGFIDYRAFFRGLREGGYKGYVAYEMCEVLEGGGSIENLDRAARQFLETFREMTK